MKDRRVSKKTFNRFAGKSILALSYITIICNLILIMFFPERNVSGFGPIYVFLGVLFGGVYGSQRHSDYMKERVSEAINLPEVENGREP